MKTMASIQGVPGRNPTGFNSDVDVWSAICDAYKQYSPIFLSTRPWEESTDVKQ